MSKEEIRIQCLKIASDMASQSVLAISEIPKTAQTFFDFVMTGYSKK